MKQWLIRQLDCAPRHIRRVPDEDEGLKYGGGITTSSLCGYVQAQEGWDLATDIGVILRLGVFHEPRHVCRKCALKYARIIAAMRDA